MKIVTLLFLSIYSLHLCTPRFLGPHDNYQMSWLTCSRVTTPIPNGLPQLQMLQKKLQEKNYYLIKNCFTSVIPGQDHKAAATSCFCVYSSWSFLLWILVQMRLIPKQMHIILLQRRLIQLPRRRIEVQMWRIHYLIAQIESPLYNPNWVHINNTAEGF